MDLAVYARVLWRFKFLVFGGVLLAILFATLSFAKISLAHGFTYRKPLTYQSASTVLITRQGFPLGSLSGAAGTGSLTSLAIVYAQLAASDPVKAHLRLRPGEVGGIGARPILDYSQGCCLPLPLVAVEGFSTSPSDAIDLATRGTQAFIAYVTAQQNAAAIRPSDRVILQVLNPPSGASVVAPRKKTLPIMIFVLVVTATLGLAFMLENLRPSVRVAPGQLQEEQAAKRRPAVGTVAEEKSAGAKSV